MRQSLAAGRFTGRTISAHAADSVVGEGTLLPGPASGPQVIPGRIGNPEVRQAPRAILEIPLKRPPSRDSQIAFTGDIVHLGYELRTCGRQPRRKGIRDGLARCPALTAPHRIDTYASGVIALTLGHLEVQYPRV